MAMRLSLVNSTSSPQDLGLRVARGPADQGSGPIMTLRKLQEAIRSGRGQGRHENYKPWDEITRSVSSPISNMGVSPTPLYPKRSLHQRSLLERSGGHLALWLGATEVRERIPMWPETHPHPCDGSGTVRGLVEITRGLGLKHRFYAYSKIPRIQTLDLMLQFRDGSGPYFVGWDCMPRREGLAEQRQAKSFRIRQAYCEEVGARPIRYVGDMVPKRLLTNLDWLMPLHDEWVAVKQTSALVDYAEEFNRICDVMPLGKAQKKVAAVLGITDLKLAHAYFRMAAWNGSIDIDLSRPVLMSRPLLRDRDGVKASLAQQLTSRS